MSHSEAFLKLVNDAKTRIKEISTDAVMDKIEKGDDFYFVDTREQNEWAAGRCQNAIYIGKGVIERDVEKLIPDRKAEIVLYCGGGFRSALAADMLEKMGYENVLSMAGGIREWREKGFPEDKGGD